MSLMDNLNSLDGRKLALVAYVSRYGSEQVFNVGSLRRDFPFIRHLFSGDPQDLEEMLVDLKHDAYLVAQDDKLKTYNRSEELERDKVWPVIHRRLIDIDRSFVRDRILKLIGDISLHDFLELERSYSSRDFRDPFLAAFADDRRIGRDDWWERVCTLANLYDNADQHGAVSELYLNFVRTSGLEASKQDHVGLRQQIDQIWANKGIVEFRATVEDITAYKKSMVIQVIFVRWADISIERRDDIIAGALGALLEDATIAHAILPIGHPDKQDEDILKSTQLIIFTPDDVKKIVIGKRPADRFREMLRSKMDIELLSPYQTTSYVPDSMFFGRNYEVRLIAANPKTNYAIYGGRQSGKTSLMMKLWKLYQKKCKIVFLDCELVSRDEDFLAMLCRKLGLPTVKSYSDFLALEKNIETNTLFLIDEVDHMFGTCDSKQVIGVLRYLNEEYQTRCILSGAAGLYRQFQDVSSPMYNFADPLLLGPFTELEAILLAKGPMDSLDVSYEGGNSTAKQLINLCGRFPNLIQLMCHELVKNAKTKKTRTITPQLLTEVYQSEAFGGYVEKLFHHNFNASQKLIVYAALMVKTMPLGVIVEKVQAYHYLGITKIEDLLEELVLLFVLAKDGNIYRWAYDGFPRILKQRIQNLNLRIDQTVKEIKKLAERQEITDSDKV